MKIIKSWKFKFIYFEDVHFRDKRYAFRIEKPIPFTLKKLFSRYLFRLDCEDYLIGYPARLLGGCNYIWDLFLGPFNIIHWKQ